VEEGKKKPSFRIAEKNNNKTSKGPLIKRGETVYFRKTFVAEGRGKSSFTTTNSHQEKKGGHG